MLRILPQSGRTLESKLAAIEALNLDNVLRKLQRPKPDGLGLKPACAVVAVKWYKRFLTLIAKYPQNKIVPNEVIDGVWHAHILDTKAYGVDMHAIFGKFIHHNPYFGMNGDEAERDSSFAETNRLYILEFGEKPCGFGEVGLECSTDCGWVDKADCNVGEEPVGCAYMEDETDPLMRRMISPIVPAGVLPFGAGM